MPQSNRAAKAVVHVNFSPLTTQSTNPMAAFGGFLPSYSNFTAQYRDPDTNQESVFNFVTLDSYPVVVNGSQYPNKWVAENVTLYQGTVQRQQYVYRTTDNVTQTFIIPNVQVDIDTLRVRVQNSVSDLTGRDDYWTRAENILDVNGQSKVYYLQVENNQYQIRFGDGVFGKNLTNGNVVLVEYLSTDGSVANGIGVKDTANRRSFTYSGVSSDVILVSPSLGGSNFESIDSIKFNALNQFQNQNRAVTGNDYQTLLEKSLGGLDSVKVWGGEESIPPEFGKVFIALKPKNGLTYSIAEKQTIINQYILPKAVVGIIPVVVDPDYLYLHFDLRVNVNTAQLGVSTGILKRTIQVYVQNYIIEKLNKFGNHFLYSSFVSGIDDLDRGVVSNEAIIQLQKRLVPTAGKKYHTVRYHNPIESFSSSSFIWKNPSNNLTYDNAFLKADDSGNIHVYWNSNGEDLLASDVVVGSVNWETGLVQISNLEMTVNTSRGNHIRLIASPRSKDVYVSQNTIITTDINDTQYAGISITLR